MLVEDIFAIKKEIEASTPYKCCLVYGTLPPEIRAQQARLFNDPNSEYEILVASDAIGERCYDALASDLFVLFRLI